MEVNTLKSINMKNIFKLIVYMCIICNLHVLATHVKFKMKHEHFFKLKLGLKRVRFHQGY